MGLVLQGTLAPVKHLNCCVNVYGGQKCAPLWHNFANNVVHVHLQKIALNMPMEHCNHCRYHLPDSIPTPLTLFTDLPPARGFNCVLTVINCLTKFMRLIPCTMGEDKLSAAQVAKLLFENIVRFFGVPKELVHDRDPRFTAHLWRELWRILGTKTSASTAFHP